MQLRLDATCARRAAPPTNVQECSGSSSGDQRGTINVSDTVDKGAVVEYSVGYMADARMQPIPAQAFLKCSALTKNTHSTHCIFKNIGWRPLKDRRWKRVLLRSMG